MGYIKRSYSYCVIICFFFFKQKTAYEMRISDWSSDVCSSDLLSRRRPFRTTSRDAPTSAAIAPQSDARPITVSAVNSSFTAVEKATFCRMMASVAREWRTSHESFDRSSDMRATSEIGRASCRERVCQYG